MKYRFSIVLMLVLVVFTACQPAPKTPQSFIMAVDWRYTATEPYRSEEYFLGALQAIKKIGLGMFMVSPGDVEPPDASRELIDQVLGSDYLWYPAMGNHELEDTVHINYLRKLNAGETSLPNVVRKGPPGCEETTYAFEIGDCHVAVLNQYYDGKSDIGTDGDVVPELLEWLENDLNSTTKPFVFVAGHEPLVAMPDMDNGRIRHQGNSLDQYPDNAAKFHNLMRNHHVIAYLTGHTHGASVAKINGVWQIDGGHARGTEDLFPEYVYEQMHKRISLPENTNRSEEEVIAEYFKGQEYNLKKVLDYAGLTGDTGYKEISDADAFPLLVKFYRDYRDNRELCQQYIETYHSTWHLTKSTFVRIILENPVKAEIYRNDARGGNYQLTDTFILN
jgi:hypothetical protein